MEVKTLGLMAAAGMFLSSLTVWSLTTPRPEAPPLVATGTLPPVDEPVATNQAASQFVSGNTLLVEGRLGFKTLEAGKPAENFVFVDITTDKTAVGKSTPLNLAIVLDRSGSMKGKRLANALSAARGMIERLRDGDVISLVTYNQSAQSTIESVQIDGSSRFRVLRELDELQAQGDTCISCGLEAAKALLGRRSGMVDQVLLLSDGEATTGVLDEAGFRRIAADAQRMGVTISTVGVDVDYNERVMSLLAEESNGRHHFVEHASKLPSIFDEEFKSLANTLADEAELSVSLAPGVRVLKVFDRSYRQDGARLIVPMGAFSVGDEKTLLVKVEVPAAKVGSRPIADVHLVYRDLTTGRNGNCEGSLSHALVKDTDQLSPLDPLVAMRVERSETAQTLLGANALIKEGKVDQARALLAEEKKRKARAREVATSNSFSSATKGKGDLDRDFAKQEQALGEAEASVAPAPAGKPMAPRRAKAAVRWNQSAARDAAF